MTTLMTSAWPAGARWIAAALCAAASLQAAQAGEWVRYASDEHKFEAQFPADPVVKAAADANGTKTTTFVGNDGVGSVCFVVIVEPAARSAAVELSSVRDSFIKGVGASVAQSEETIFSAGGKDLPALKFDAVNDTARLRSLVVAQGKRAVQVVGMIPFGALDSNWLLDRCVKNFKLTP